MDQEPGRTQPSSLLVPTLITVVVHALIPIGLLWFLVIQVPQFQDIFASLDVELPTLTQIVLSVSAVAKDYFLLLVPLLGGLLALDGFISCSLRRSGRKTPAMLWGLLVILVEGTAAGLAGLAMRLPFLPLMEALGKQGG